MKLSVFGEKFTSHSGILSLMDDLGNALADGQNKIMMGGGNPAHIPQVDAVFRQRLRDIIDSQSEFTRLVGTYDPPQGEKRFVRELAAYLKRQFGWPLTERNIALTNGSQAAFFMLFNMFAGSHMDGSHRRIQLPMAPEYIGYVDCGLSQDFFVANKPDIEDLEEHLFKYRVNFQDLVIDDSVAALCVSRPTNPTGNVLTDQEMARLDGLAHEYDIPLIVDGAYGIPFPKLIFTAATPHWNEHTILCLSLSKLGLPAVRTGIVVACQAGRSQHQNRAKAWEMLRSKLYELELQKRREAAQDSHDSKSDIGWGHQIRSYVLQPYQLVKDLRTDHETSDTSGVLDGDIDAFLSASLAHDVGATREEEA